MTTFARTVVAALASGALGLGLVGCGDDDAATSTTEATAETTTTLDVTTSSAATTTTGATTTVEAVLDGIRAELAAAYEAGHDPGITGPAEPICDDSGPIAVGAVFVCSVQTPTTPSLGPIEHANLVVYVLDATGLAAWNMASDIPGSTDELRRVHDLVPGLFCRDLLGPEADVHPFSGDGTASATSYFWSLVYWSLEGEPDRMDEDGNGIPCETLYEPEIVAEVLGGGAVG